MVRAQHGIIRAIPCEARAQGVPTCGAAGALTRGATALPPMCMTFATPASTAPATTRKPPRICSSAAASDATCNARHLARCRGACHSCACVRRLGPGPGNISARTDSRATSARHSSARAPGMRVRGDQRHAHASTRRLCREPASRSLQRRPCGRRSTAARPAHATPCRILQHATCNIRTGHGSPGACNAPSELAMLAVPCRTAERHGAALALPHAATPASACKYGRQHSRNGAVHAVARQHARLGSSQ